MIQDSEISECPEYVVKSKTGNIFVNKKILEEYSVKTYGTDPYFYENYKKKYKLMKMGTNIYYLELMFIFLNILWLQKLMKKVILTGTEEKRQETLEKNLVKNLLELIQVSVMIKIMKLVEYKHLLVSLKIDN